MRASERMPTFSRSSFSQPLKQVALTLSLLSSASMVAAQSAPPPRQIIQAPPPAAQPAAPPAPQPYQAGQSTYPEQPSGYPAQPQQAPQQYQQQPQPYPGQPPQGYPPPPPQGYPPPPPGGAYQPQGYPGQYQPYAAPPVVWQRPQRPARGLMIAGISVLGGSYLLSAAIGGGILDDRSDYNNYNHTLVGRWLFVPVVGPFVAMSHAGDGSWGLWFLGMVQLVGAGLTTGGVIRYRNSKRALDAQGMTWDLGHNRALTLDVQSGPRAIGPHMRLAF